MNAPARIRGRKVRNRRNAGAATAGGMTARARTGHRATAEVRVTAQTARKVRDRIVHRVTAGVRAIEGRMTAAGHRVSMATAGVRVIEGRMIAEGQTAHKVTARIARRVIGQIGRRATAGVREIEDRMTAAGRRGSMATADLVRGGQEVPRDRAADLIRMGIRIPGIIITAVHTAVADGMAAAARRVASRQILQMS